MGKFLSPIVLSLIISGSANAQSNAFDFWQGTWEASWTDKDGNVKKGKNTIVKILNGKVLQENFQSLEGDEDSQFIGKSWSVYNAGTDTWKQTWVDNSGAYLEFIGEIDGEDRIFKRKVKKDGVWYHSRMVFYDIEKDSFTWDWESSNDGKNWNLLWRINYTRNE